ncbi:hypothetical protein DFH06DRAFT_286276 [Mycena polygramma]|nr:hypothetical protein DFH06DRAFT_286276 [Mycena polygramma]
MRQLSSEQRLDSLDTSMQFISSTLIALALSTLAALAAPNALEKKAEKCRIVADGSRCRRSASTSADIIGQFAVGATPTFSCYTTGTTVDGSNIWDRTTINIGGSAVQCFVSDTLVALPCPGGLPHC